MTSATRAPTNTAVPIPSDITAVLQTCAAFRIDRVAQMLDVSRSTVYRLIRDKRLTLIKIGKRGSRVTAESVSELLKARETPDTA